jgi:uncharacterized protein (DUF342 family)
MDKNKKKISLSNLKDELANENKTQRTEPLMKITYNEDMTEAYLIIKPVDNYKVSEQKIRMLIEKEEITYGVFENVLPKIVKHYNSQDLMKAKKYVIAKGDPPLDTIPESVKITSVVGSLIIQGEIVGKHIEKKEGEFGKSVKNKKVAPKIAKEGIVLPGKNLYKFEHEGEILYSSNITGVLIINKKTNEAEILPEEEGKFNINVSPIGEVLLSVYPPIGRKDPVNFKAVDKKIKELKISSIINYESVKSALSAGVKDIIKDYVIGKGIPKDYDIKVSITDDKMAAYINIIRPIIEKNSLTRESIIEALEQAGVKKGYSENSIDELVEKIEHTKESIENVLIAEGEEPTEDTEDNLTYDIRIYEKNTGITIPDLGGEIKKIGDVGEEVKPNTLLCTVTKGSRSGLSGYNVLGDRLAPIRYSPINLRAGKNVKLKKERNKNEYYSTKKGTVYIYDNTINVIDTEENKK